MPENNIIVKTEDFYNFINTYTCPVISYANYALSAKGEEYLFNISFLGKSHSVASRLEEVLDHYNAKKNMEWKSFRENVAAIKLFTNAGYITLHLKSASPKYSLLSGIDIFLTDTEAVLNLFYSALQSSFSDLIQNGKTIGLENCTEIHKRFSFSVNSPEGILESNIKKRHIANPEKVIVNLATSYLNLASDSESLKKIGKSENKNYDEMIPDVLNENIIRTLESKYHNLQSLYDTYISNSDIEDLDEDLKLIRGHVSIVYHLLEASTNLIHYYERHMMNLTGINYNFEKSPISKENILGILVDYFLNYANQYLTSGVTLCHKVIKKYAEEGSIIVKVPVYRGFHVRPSTLVSKIVKHYGSEVYLHIDNEKYDASHPMELFCVNEKINAEKRRNLSQNICKMNLVKNAKDHSNYLKSLKDILYKLLKDGKIINYTSDFLIPEIKPLKGETLAEFTNRAIAFLLAQGKIDLKTDLTVSFVGDKRVLSDLELLANCGYGEDSYGNNIMLPYELRYVRK